MALLRLLLADLTERDSANTFFSSFKTYTLKFTVFLSQKQYPLCKSLAEGEYFRSKVSPNLHWIHYTAIGLERFLNAKIVYTVSISLSYAELVLLLERYFDALMEIFSHFKNENWKEIGVLKRTLSIAIVLSGSAKKPWLTCSTCSCRVCIRTVGRCKLKQCFSSSTVLMAASHMPWVALSHCVRIHHGK